MTVREQLTQDMKQAMRDRNSLALEAIRFILAKIQNFEIDKPSRELVTDAEAQQIVKKIVKDSEEAVSQYQAGGRQDLVDIENEKIQISKRYLPQQLTDDQVWELIQGIRAAQPDVTTGPLTGQVIKAAQGKTDGGTVNRLLRERA